VPRPLLPHSDNAGSPRLEILSGKVELQAYRFSTLTSQDGFGKYCLELGYGHGVGIRSVYLNVLGTGWNSRWPWYSTVAAIVVANDRRWSNGRQVHAGQVSRHGTPDTALKLLEKGAVELGGLLWAEMGGHGGWEVRFLVKMTDKTKCQFTSWVTKCP
jgi:hypothetical protein